VAEHPETRARRGGSHRIEGALQFVMAAAFLGFDELARISML
jgi:hypothetical protein